MALISPSSVGFHSNTRRHRGWLNPIRQRIDSVSIRSAKSARLLARLIPAQCPFERDVKVLGHKIAHIPPLCKLNPLYDELVGLRFRALCYLADNCGEDISAFI
ncbi:MAG: Mo-dependent nitrogenase C-terminal domain-containing protein [Cyanobacteria bacterium P01_H01_bin.119]